MKVIEKWSSILKNKTIKKSSFILPGGLVVGDGEFGAESISDDDPLLASESEI